MKFMDKIKNLFTEEVEEEKPIKKEVIQVEIPSPEVKKVEKASEAVDITENDTLKKDEKFVFPVYFDDKDFADLDKKKEEKKVEVDSKKVYQSRQTKNYSREYPKKETYKDAYQGSKEVKEEKKLFKPSPIISPVYGVLDKNYSKEDVVSRGEKKQVHYSKTGEISIDDVRKKAFGTLEDDLENSLFDYSEYTEIGEASDVNMNIFDELEIQENEEKSKKEDISSPIVLDVEDNVEGKNEIDDFMNETTKNDDNNYVDTDGESIEPISKDSLENEANKLDDTEIENKNLDSDDLFNLIDSMYEKRDDE